MSVLSLESVLDNFLKSIAESEQSEWENEVLRLQVEAEELSKQLSFEREAQFVCDCHDFYKYSVEESILRQEERDKAFALRLRQASTKATMFLCALRDILNATDTADPLVVKTRVDKCYARFYGQQ